jgi:hypothetical protein
MKEAAVKKQVSELSLTEATRKSADLIDSARLAACLSNLVAQVLTLLQSMKEGGTIPSPAELTMLATACVSEAFKVKVPTPLVQIIQTAKADRTPISNHGRT